MEKRVIFCFHEDQYQNLLAARYPLHEIIGFEQHFGGKLIIFISKKHSNFQEIIDDGPVKEMLRGEFPFIKELVHSVCTRRKVIKK